MIDVIDVIDRQLPPDARLTRLAYALAGVLYGLLAGAVIVASCAGWLWLASVLPTGG